jgi:5'-methylthioadenosine phosphorylase
VAGQLPKARTCPCASALEHAIITDRSRIPDAAKRDLRLIIGKYLA